jgi:hypothetical protein
MEYLDTIFDPAGNLFQVYSVLDFAGNEVVIILPL